MGSGADGMRSCSGERGKPINAHPVTALGWHLKYLSCVLKECYSAAHEVLEGYPDRSQTYFLFPGTCSASLQLGVLWPETKAELARAQSLANGISRSISDEIDDRVDIERRAIQILTNLADGISHFAWMAMEMRDAMPAHCDRIPWNAEQESLIRLIRAQDELDALAEEILRIPQWACTGRRVVSEHFVALPMRFISEGEAVFVELNQLTHLPDIRCAVASSWRTDKWPSGQELLGITDAELAGLTIVDSAPHPYRRSPASTEYRKYCYAGEGKAATATQQILARLAKWHAGVADEAYWLWELVDYLVSRGKLRERAWPGDTSPKTINGSSLTITKGFVEIEDLLGVSLEHAPHWLGEGRKSLSILQDEVLPQLNEVTPEAEADSEERPSADVPPRRGGAGMMSKQARALAVKTEHPDWSDAKIAEAAGCHVKSLYRWKLFVRAKAMLKEGRGGLPKGRKAKDKPMEAWDDDDGEESRE